MSSIKEEKECPICFMQKNLFTLNSCKHKFCSVCLLTWLNQKNSCPNCRSQENTYATNEDGEIIKTTYTHEEFEESKFVSRTISVRGYDFIRQREVTYTRHVFNIDDRSIREEKNKSILTANKAYIKQAKLAQRNKARANNRKF